MYNYHIEDATLKRQTGNLNCAMHSQSQCCVSLRGLSEARSFFQQFSFLAHIQTMFTLRWLGRRLSTPSSSLFKTPTPPSCIVYLHSRLLTTTLRPEYQLHDEAPLPYDMYPRCAHRGLGLVIPAPLEAGLLFRWPRATPHHC